MGLIDGAHFATLTEGLDRAIQALLEPIEGDPALWLRGKPGKWTAGGHCEHVALTLEQMPRLFVDSARLLAEGSLAQRPGRGLLESLFVEFVARRGMMPRGAAAIAPTFPSAEPQQASVVARLLAATDSYRDPATGLDGAALDRLWIRNPFRAGSGWHYSLPEAVRLQTVHVRHHAAQVLEIAQG